MVIPHPNRPEGYGNQDTRPRWEIGSFKVGDVVECYLELNGVMQPSKPDCGIISFVSGGAMSVTVGCNSEGRAVNVCVNQLLGISMDEAHRMKPSRDIWIKNIYPLIDKDLTRGHCLEWMESHGYPTPPRSACVYCPFHSDAEWHRIKTEMPKEFQFAVNFEKELQKKVATDKRIKSKPYLHNSCKPLDEVHFDVNKSLDLYGNECEGMCGV